MVVAATLDRPGTKREVTVRCMNLGMEPRELNAGTVIGMYQPVEEDQIEASDVRAQSVLPDTCPDHVTKCPPHVQPETSTPGMRDGQPVCKISRPVDRIPGCVQQGRR